MLILFFFWILHTPKPKVKNLRDYQSSPYKYDGKLTNHNYRMWCKQGLSLNILNLQLDLCAWSWTTRPVRKSNSLSYPQQRDLHRKAFSRGHSPRTNNFRNIQIDDLTVLSFTRKVWMSCKNSSTDSISTAQFWWNIKRLLTIINDYSISGIFSISWVEKNKLLLEKIKLTHYLTNLF